MKWYLVFILASGQGMTFKTTYPSFDMCNKIGTVLMGMAKKAVSEPGGEIVGYVCAKEEE